eukprot:jgi/Chlat1/5828/Chrsp4S06362
MAVSERALMLYDMIESGKRRWGEAAVVVVLGVAGCGKTWVREALAQACGAVQRAVYVGAYDEAEAREVVVKAVEELKLVKGTPAWLVVDGSALACSSITPASIPIIYELETMPHAPPSLLLSAALLHIPGTTLHQHKLPSQACEAFIKHAGARCPWLVDSPLLDIAAAGAAMAVHACDSGDDITLAAAFELMESLLWVHHGDGSKPTEPLVHMYVLFTVAWALLSSTCRIPGTRASRSMSQQHTTTSQHNQVCLRIDRALRDHCRSASNRNLEAVLPAPSTSSSMTHATTLICVMRQRFVPWEDEAGPGLAPQGTARGWSTAAGTHPGHRHQTLLSSPLCVWVPTPFALACRQLARLLALSGRPLLITGPRGSGKTCAAMGVYLRQGGDASLPPHVHITATTRANDLKVALMETAEKDGRGGVRPRNKEPVLVVDDLHVGVCTRGRVSARAPKAHEWVRQLLDSSTFYHSEEGTHYRVEGVHVVGVADESMSYASSRLLRHFFMMRTEDEVAELFARAVLVAVATSTLGGAHPEWISSASLITSSLLLIKKLRTMNIVELNPLLKPLCRAMHSACRLALRALDAIDPAASIVALHQIWFHEIVRECRDGIDIGASVNLFDNVLAWLCHEVHEVWPEAQPGALIFAPEPAVVMLPLSGGPESYCDVSNGKARSEWRALIDEQIPRIQFDIEHELLTTTRVMLAPMKALFPGFMNHVMRLVRRLDSLWPNGSCALVGGPNLGRRSVAEISTRLVGAKLIRIGDISGGEDSATPAEELEALVVQAISEAVVSTTVLLVLERESSRPELLDLLTPLMMSGRVPGLISEADIDTAATLYFNRIDDVPNKAAYKDSHALFAAAVRHNLHIVLVTSPTTYQSLASTHPALHANLLPNMFHPPIDEELYPFFLESLTSESSQASVIEDPQSLAKLCVCVHKWAVTHAAAQEHDRLSIDLDPASLALHVPLSAAAELVHHIKTFITNHKKLLNRETARVRTACGVLSAARVRLAKRDAELAEVEPLLASAASESSELLVGVTDAERSVDELHARLAEDEARVSRTLAQVATLRETTEEDLARAEAAYADALADLRHVTREDLQAVRGYQTPPGLVRLVMESICLLLGLEPDWPAVRRLLMESINTAIAGISLRSRLERFDRERVADATLRSLQKYVRYPSFRPTTVEQSNHACSYLCAWVLAVDGYTKVKGAAVFKAQKIAEAQRRIEVTQQTAIQMQERVHALEEEIVVKQGRRSKTLATQEKFSTARDALLAEIAQLRAMVGTLAGQEAKWEAYLLELDARAANLRGFAALAAACLSHLAPFGPAGRSKALQDLRTEGKAVGVEMNSSFDLLPFLAFRETKSPWVLSESKCSERCLRETVATIGFSRQRPLLVDPYGAVVGLIGSGSVLRTGARWRKMTAWEPNLIANIQESVRSGASVLLEVAAPYDVAVLSRMRANMPEYGMAYGGAGAGGCIVDDAVDRAQGLRLILYTREANTPGMPAEVFDMFNVVDCRRSGEGMRAFMSRKLRPALVSDHLQRLISDHDTASDMIQELMRKTVVLISKSGGEVWNDSTLVDTLVATTVSLEEYEGRLAQALTDIEAVPAISPGLVRLGRHAVCAMSAARQLMPRISVPLVSLDSFASDYAIHITKALEGIEEANQEAAISAPAFVSEAVANTMRGFANSLLNEQMLLLRLLASAMFLRDTGKVTDSEWDFFIRQEGVQTLSELAVYYPVKHLLNGVQALREKEVVLWESCRRKMQAIACGGDVDDTPAAAISPLPEHWVNRLTAFQHMCLLQSAYPDYGLAAMEWLCTQVGCKAASISTDAVSRLRVALERSTRTTPIFVMCATRGAEPMLLMRQLARRVGLPAAKLLSVAQDDDIDEVSLAIADAQRLSDWLCVQCTDITSTWLRRVHRHLVERDSGEEFRLWLLMELSDVTRLTVDIAAAGHVVVIGEPACLRDAVFASYHSLPTSVNRPGMELLRPQQMNAFKRCAFGLILFHAVANWRGSRYAGAGWRISPCWSHNDFMAALVIIQQHVNALAENCTLDFRTLASSLSTVYSTLLGNPFDAQQCEALLEKFVSRFILTDQYVVSSRTVGAPPDNVYLEDINRWVTDILPPSADIDLLFLPARAHVSALRNGYTHFLSLLPRISAPGNGATPVVAAKSIPLQLDDMTNSLRSMRKAWPVSKSFTSAVLLEEAEDMDAILGVLSRTLPIPLSQHSTASPTLDASLLKSAAGCVRFLERWHSGAVLRSYDLAEIVRPDRLLLACLQEYARAESISLADAAFKAQVLSFRAASSTVGVPTTSASVALSGVVLMGALWDSRQEVLAFDSDMGCADIGTLGSNVTQQLCILFTPCRLADALQSAAGSFHSCPLYLRKQNGEHLCVVDLPSRCSPSEWSCRGTSLTSVTEADRTLLTVLQAAVLCHYSFT